jgi:hypothetical protein
MSNLNPDWNRKPEPPRDLFCRNCFSFGHERKNCPNEQLRNLTEFDYQWLRNMGISPR